MQEIFGSLQLPSKAAPEGLAALAALVKHLRRLHAESELITQAQMVNALALTRCHYFEMLCPHPCKATPAPPPCLMKMRSSLCSCFAMSNIESVQVAPYDLFEAALRLDGPTLQNLDLLETQEGETKGSLMSVLDTCASAGKLTTIKVTTRQISCNTRALCSSCLLPTSRTERQRKS